MTGGGERERSSWLVACHLSSLPGFMNCKSRAEAFARHLHNKFKFLGGGRATDDDDDNACNDSDGVAESNSTTSPVEITNLMVTSPATRQLQTQPVHDDEDELYYDFDLASSSGSPQSPDSHQNSTAATNCSQIQCRLEMKSDSTGQYTEASAKNSTLNSTVTETRKTTRESEPQEPGESAYNSAGEQESNVTVLEQGQIDLSKLAGKDEEAREEEDDDALSVIQIKRERDENQKNLTVNDSNNQLNDNNQIEDDDDEVHGEDDEVQGEDEDDNNGLPASPVWGTLKQIDRFHVRKVIKNDDEEQETTDDATTDNDVTETNDENSGDADDATLEMASAVQEEVVFPDEGTIEGRPKHIYRSSSLKTGKTPPGTPGQKKFVRFADVLGLDLEAVRHVFLDDLPHVPQSAYSDLDAGVIASDPAPLVNQNPGKTLVPMFSQPCSASNFPERVRLQKVSLENAALIDGAIRGQIRVLNLHFDKKVYVRFTFNEWRNHIEVEANFVSGSSDGFSDKFSFCIYGGDQVQIGERFVFCVRYVTIGQEFWDNNHGHNYYFQCIQDNVINKSQLSSSSSLEDWIHFL